MRMITWLAEHEIINLVSFVTYLIIDFVCFPLELLMDNFGHVQLCWPQVAFDCNELVVIFCHMHS